MSYRTFISYQQKRMMGAHLHASISVVIRCSHVALLESSVGALVRLAGQIRPSPQKMILHEPVKLHHLEVLKIFARQLQFLLSVMCILRDR